MFPLGEESWQSLPRRQSQTAMALLERAMSLLVIASFLPPSQITYCSSTCRDSTHQVGSPSRDRLLCPLVQRFHLCQHIEFDNDAVLRAWCFQRLICSCVVSNPPSGTKESSGGGFTPSATGIIFGICGGIGFMLCCVIAILIFTKKKKGGGKQHVEKM